jgi:hypothetical protein
VGAENKVGACALRAARLCAVRCARAQWVVGVGVGAVWRLGRAAAGLLRQGGGGAAARRRGRVAARARRGVSGSTGSHVSRGQKAEAWRERPALGAPRRRLQSSSTSSCTRLAV